MAPWSSLIKVRGNLASKYSFSVKAQTVNILSFKSHTFFVATILIPKTGSLAHVPWFADCCVEVLSWQFFFFF